MTRASQAFNPGSIALLNAGTFSRLNIPVGAWAGGPAVKTPSIKLVFEARIPYKVDIASSNLARPIWKM